MGNLARRCEFLEQPESTVRYTLWRNLTGRFLNYAVFSLHLSRDIDHILCYNFSTPNETFSPYKKVSETMSVPETSVELSENQLFDFSISIAGRITKLHLDLHKTVVLSDTVCTAE